MTPFAEMLTQDNLHAFDELGAPWRELLEAAPLWFAPHHPSDRRYRTQWSLHSDKDCPELPAGAPDQGRVDLASWFVGETAETFLCSCTSGTYSGAPAGQWEHPLHWLKAMASSVVRLRNTQACGTPKMVQQKEYELAFVRLRIADALTSIGDRPEFTVWTDWLTSVLADGACRVDRLRIDQQRQLPIPVRTDDMLVSVSVFARTNIEHLTLHQRQVLTACHALFRSPQNPSIVVRVPREFLPNVNTVRPGTTWYAHVLGPVRPMTAQAWELYGRLAAASYGLSDAYTAAADSVGRLDGDTIRLLDPLIGARVPAAELISTAVELAR